MGNVYEITVQLFSYDEVKGQEHNQEKKNEISPLKLQNADSPFSVSEQVFLVSCLFEHITDLLMKPRVTPSLEAHFLFPIIPLPYQCYRIFTMS